MIYLTLLLLVLAIFFSYKKLNHVSARFMYGIILAWGLSFTSFILYLSKFNYYHNIISSFFSFSPGTWNYLVLTNFNPDLLIRMLNGGVLLFHFSLLCFAISFTRTSKKLRNAPIYTIVTIISLIQLLFYDPWIQIGLQLMIADLPPSLSAFSKEAVIWLNQLFKYINYAYEIIALVLMLNFYFNYPKIKFIKNYALYHILILAPVAIIHFLIFSWAPKNLVIATVLSGYYNYLLPDIGSYPFIFVIFPYLVPIGLAFMIYIMYRYNSIEAYNKSHDIQINNSIDTASLGVKAFTHSLKNHLLAIQFEAEYLKEIHTDKESLYSLNLMLASCNKGMESITYAANKLQAIELNLQPHLLNVSVNEAVARLNLDPNHIKVHVRADEEPPLCYVDNHFMSEVIFNLLENAVESLSQQQSGSIDISISERNNWAILSIHDDGPGIAEEHLESIFSPFFTTKASVNNWGIGLSYCHKIVVGHDGKIIAESSKEQGTTFKIFLPVI